MIFFCFILGDSSSSAELLLHEHKKLIPEARQLQERALKITKATEQLVSSGCFAGEQATYQAYTVLSATSDYLSDLEQREHLLQRAITFFRNAQTVLTLIFLHTGFELTFFPKGTHKARPIRSSNKNFRTTINFTATGATSWTMRPSN